MSQTKAQLIQPIGVVTASGVVVSGVMTAATFDGDIVGSATSVIQGKNLNLGAFNATSFAGDFTGNATGIITSSAIKVGQLTASSFVGDFTGTATSMMRGTGFEAGAVTGSSFVADVTGNVTGNATGIAGTVLQGSNIHVGVVTATSLYGDGSNMTGIAATNFNTQTVTANSGSTAIDLSAGNMIKLVQSAETTISFANTSTSQYLTIIRDNGSGDISWPEEVKWDGGSPPIPTSSSSSNDYQAINLLTRDGGLTWYGWEDVNCVGGTSTWVWGDGWAGQMGQNDDKGYSSPVQLGGTIPASDPDWKHGAFAGGRFYYGSLATKTNGTMWYWGQQYSSPLNGAIPATYISSPTQVGSGDSDNWGAALNYTYAGFAAIRTNGTLWSWGYNNSGVLGQNNRTWYSSPIQIPGGYHRIGAGAGTWAVKKDYTVPSPYRGTLWAIGGSFWGGSLGQNEHGGLQYRSSPVQVPGTNWHTCLSGGYAVVATKTDGSLWSWGSQSDTDDGGHGSLGQNNQTKYSSPTQIGTDTTWDKSDTGFVMSNTFVNCLKTDGTLWAWGGNQYGQSALNDTNNRSSPTQVGTDTTWSELAAQAYACYGKKTDGTLWAWGYDARYMGLSPLGNRRFSSPHQIPGTTWDMLGGMTRIGSSATMMKREF